MKKGIYCGFFSFIFICLLATGMSSCYYDKEELLYPNSQNCDTAAVKYSTSVVPILSASCISCHGGSFPSGAVKLDTYNDARVHALSGRLYGSISHSTGYSQMPQGQAKLSDCKIQTIKTWIDAGAPNN